MTAACKDGTEVFCLPSDTNIEEIFNSAPQLLVRLTRSGAKFVRFSV
jgi:hypothetical protein